MFFVRMLRVIGYFFLINKNVDVFFFKGSFFSFCGLGCG